MTSIEDLTIEQDTDREIDQDHDTGELLAQERARSQPPKINALTLGEYRAGKKPPVTFDRLWRESGYSSRHRVRPLGPSDESVHVPFERYDRGSDQDDPGTKPSPPVHDGRVGDLVADGHGFSTRRLTTNPDALEVCRFCGERLLSEDQASPCEFAVPTYPSPMAAPRARPTKYGVPVWVKQDGDLVRPLGDEPAPAAIDSPGFDPDRCRCNGCTIRRDGRRERGGQPVQCGKPECRSALRKEQNTRKRERDRMRDRLYAVEVIRADPYRPDRDIAADLMIPAVRVKEARQLLSS